MRNTLICTVGTSLLNNINNIKPESTPNWRELKAAYDEKNWKMLSLELLKLNPADRVCGAEINTIEEVRSKNWLSFQNIFFLVSATPEGEAIGAILVHYFKNRIDLGLQNVDACRIEHLQDTNPKDFKIHGLRNLVREIGKLIQRFGLDSIALDATGGYKAQIAVALLVGQSLNIPVYYKHERFPEIIDFPPMPISLDYSILAENADVLTDFERGRCYSQDELGQLDDRLKVLLNEEVVDGKSMFELGAIGQIYLTSYRLRYPKPLQLHDAKSDERLQPTFGNDHHYPNGFKEFVEKVWRENKWIKTCYTTSYDQQASIKGTGFFVKQEGEAKHLIGTFKGADFRSRFILRLTVENQDTLTWAADQLNQKYRD